MPGSRGSVGAEGSPRWPPRIPRVHPAGLPLTFRKHVAHVQHGHEIVDVTVDALGHTRVLRGSRGVPGRALLGNPTLPAEAHPDPMPRLSDRWDLRCARTPRPHQQPSCHCASFHLPSEGPTPLTLTCPLPASPAQTKSAGRLCHQKSLSVCTAQCPVLTRCRGRKC